MVNSLHCRVVHGGWRGQGYRADRLAWWHGAKPGTYNRGLMLLSPMQTLRHVRWLVRLVLAGVVLSLGVAGGWAVGHPPARELICAGAGVIELRSHTDGGAVPQSGHQPDCPLCVQVGAPAPGRLADQPRPHPSAQGLRARAATHIAARTAAPLPPRGPPAGL